MDLVELPDPRFETPIVLVIGTQFSCFFPSTLWHCCVLIAVQLLPTWKGGGGGGNSPCSDGQEHEL